MIAAAPPAMAKVLSLLNETGMRANEAVTLAADEVAFDRRQITLTHTKTNRPRTINFATPSGDAGRVLTDAKPRGPLFPSRDGRPYRNFPTHAAKVIALVGKANPGFRRFRVHDLRHGFAIRWLRNRGNIYELSKHLGHSGLAITEKYLGYLSVEEQNAVRFGNAPLMAAD